LSGSSSGTREVNPAGDIPDDQVFVAYAPPSGLFTLKVPEGWARSEANGVVTFTDKLNSIRVEAVAAPSAPSVGSAQKVDVPAVEASAQHATGTQVTSVRRPAGSAVLITYQADSDPDPVTGRVVRDDVERYEFWRGDHEVVLTLSAPHGADNVDPWRTVTDSLSWRA
jgi:hypothetical protein